jgi:phenylalanyl-tRNA synthetase beta chain
MQVPISWLNEIINHDYSQDKLKQKLTAIGLEAEIFTPEPINFSRVFIGKIEYRLQARLTGGYFYEVDVGSQGNAIIYSTIPNLQSGKKYPVAVSEGKVGSMEIGERLFGNQISQGKFCCSTELGLTKLEFVEHDDGTVEWKDGLQDIDGRALSIFPNCEELDVGTDLAVWLLDDKAVTIELTSNRADCHSLLGVSREMSVVTGGMIRLPSLNEDFEEKENKTSDINIQIEDPEGCSLYAGLVIDKIRMAPSPLWLAKKLLSVGLRPISNLVDITNLVLYELGQPLHSFDYDLLKDATIIVRRAKDGETMSTIDGIVRKLTPADLVIADSKNPVAIAGVMGGFESEVTGTTKKVLLESAWFDPISVRRTSRRLALRTDAAIRFERGTDPNGIIRAVHRTAQLVKELQCGEPAAEIAVARAGEQKPITVKLSEDMILRCLGEEIPTGQIETILDGLGFEVRGMAPSWTVAVPSFRRDIFIAEDVIEEIARHVGYDNIPDALPRPHMRSGLVEEDLKTRREVKEILAGLGLWELNSFPLGTEADYGRPNPLLTDVEPAVLQNPISEDASVLRLSLAPGVVNTFIRNLKRGAPVYDVFELGKVYWKDSEDFRERRELIIGCLGERFGKKKLRTREIGFLKIKGYIEALLQSVGISKYSFVSVPDAPKGTLLFEIAIGGVKSGIIEIITEEILGGETFERPVLVAVIPWDVIKAAWLKYRAERYFTTPPTFPAVERDLAFVLDESVAYRIMEESIHEAGGEHLRKIEIFDVYRGKPLEPGMKNVAVAMKFRHPVRTLTDEEVDGWMESIIDLVAKRTGGKLRDF